MTLFVDKWWYTEWFVHRLAVFVDKFKDIRTV